MSASDRRPREKKIVVNQIITWPLLEEYYCEHRARLLQWAARHVREEEAAEDLVQDVLIKLFRAYGNRPFSGCLHSTAMTALRRLTIDRARQKKMMEEPTVQRGLMEHHHEARDQYHRTYEPSQYLERCVEPAHMIAKVLSAQPAGAAGAYRYATEEDMRVLRAYAEYVLANGVHVGTTSHGGLFDYAMRYAQRVTQKTPSGARVAIWRARRELRAQGLRGD